MAVAGVELDIEPYRNELVGYCYRFFGSYPEAEDAVQETMMRAWQKADDFAGLSSVRTWLYKIATNICLDMRKAPQRRALPMDLDGPGHVGDGPPQLDTLPEVTWIGPLPDARRCTDPADAATRSESLRLAFIAALQHLPARQRAVLILRDVLAWSAEECAVLLETTVASVNSALARARSTMGRVEVEPVDASAELHLLERYMAAFESYDVDRLVALLAEDAAFSMPPYRLWLRGSTNIERWWRGPGQVCRNSRTITVEANTQPALAVYHPVEDGRWEPFAIHVLDTRPGTGSGDVRITAITHFMGAAVFEQFGLPTEISGHDAAGRSG